MSEGIQIIEKFEVQRKSHQKFEQFILMSLLSKIENMGLNENTKLKSDILHLFSIV